MKAGFSSGLACVELAAEGLMLMVRMRTAEIGSRRLWSEAWFDSLYWRWLEFVDAQVDEGKDEVILCFHSRDTGARLSDLIPLEFD